MAGIAIPEQLRPAIAAIVKYHFWILAALVPAVLVPLVFVGTGSLQQRITTQRKQIESKLSQARAVTAVQPHPNEGWQTAIEADTEAVRRETLDEWRRFWHSQRGLRTWPAELGEPFLDAVARLQPGGKLERPALVRYQNMAPRLARSLPARMGVQDAMIEERREGNQPDTAASALAPALAWNPASQKRLYDSFVWQRVPTTTQVLLAQEELWVYGLFCDLLKGFVKAQGTTGAHDSPLTFVDELTVGFPAGVRPEAGQQAGQQAGRLFVPKNAVAGAQGMPAEGMPVEGIPPMEPAPGEAPQQNPWHPRFTGASRGEPRPDAAPGGEQPAGAPEDEYRGWIYVNFAGKPLSAAELAAAADMRMVHLMPFVLRVVVDQRKLDGLLALLAANPVPIDVREVRVNPGAGGGQGTAGPAVAAAPNQAGGRRANDLVVELRGSVALATEPVTAVATPEAAP